MKIKWNPNSDNSEFKAFINGYYLLVTTNGVSVFWCVLLNGEMIASSFQRKNKKTTTIKEAQELAEMAYLKHYTKDLVFPINI